MIVEVVVDVVEVVVELGGGAVVDVVLLVVVDVLVVDVVVVDVVVVVEPETHWLLPSQNEPGSQPPHSMGVPQPSSMVPHCALSSGQFFGWQQTPNLSSGWSRTHTFVEQLLPTWHIAPGGFPPAEATSAVITKTARKNTVEINDLMGLLVARRKSPGRRGIFPANTARLKTVRRKVCVMTQ